MIILLDAMGGDNAPDANIKGAVAAIDQIQAELWLIGKEEVIKAKLKDFYNKTAEEISPRLKIYNATETIEMEDTPTLAIKHKKDSSMVVGFNLLKEKATYLFPLVTLEHFLQVQHCWSVELKALIDLHLLEFFHHIIRDWF